MIHPRIPVWIHYHFQRDPRSLSYLAFDQLNDALVLKGLRSRDGTLSLVSTLAWWKEVYFRNH
jgi:hypothetical protein